jgi:pyruvate dehydrogenase E2 component (dihydrolipoamide acetyltransferase)
MSRGGGANREASEMRDVTMPKLSDSMEVGKVIRWRVAEGDRVGEGDVLADVESDKAEMELESFHDGVVSKIVKAEGAEVPVGEVIAFIGDEGEKVGGVEARQTLAAEKPSERAAASHEGPATSKKEKAATERRVEPSPVAAPPRRTEGRVVISPYAKKLAAEKGLEYSGIRGTGPRGRIIARDVEAAAGEPRAERRPSDMRAKEGARPPGRAPAAGPEALAEEMAREIAAKYGVDLSSVRGTGTGGRITVEDVLAARPPECCPPEVRPSPDEELPALEVAEDEAEIEDATFRMKTQARRVTASKHAIPHFYVTRAVDVSKLLARKDELKERHGASVTHAVMLACIEALKKHPEVNTSYDRGRLVRWKVINLGLAVATEQGLTVAVLRNAHQMGLAQLVGPTKALVEKARAGKLSAEERSHATFTISNLGMFDVEEFQPIINPPSAVTLAVASALPAPVVREGAIHIGRLMKLTLSCDHRVVDGVMAAGFLKDLRAVLESPEDLLEGT